jgi:phage recombination protein Bet
MEKSKELSVVKATKDLMEVKVTKDDIKNLFCPLATEKELSIALGIVKSLKLNPFIREVHFIKYKTEEKISIVVGYETYLKRAERTGKLDGWKADADIEKGVAWVKIWRKDWKEPFEWTVKLSEFNKKQATWNQIPTFMGKKVAIAQGFRLAFPDELGGMPYTKEEAEVYDVQGEVVTGKPEVAIPQAVEEQPSEKAKKITEIAELVAKLTEKQKEAFLERLGSDYSVESINDLTPEQADDVIGKLKKVIAPKK